MPRNQAYLLRCACLGASTHCQICLRYPHGARLLIYARLCALNTKRYEISGLNSNREPAISPIIAPNIDSTCSAASTHTATTQDKERKFAGEILSITGILELTAQSGIDEVEAALRRLRREMPGVDRLRETAIRSETIKHLQAIGLQAPARLVDAAL